VKNHKQIERIYAQFGPFSKQRKSLKLSPLEKVESALAAWFKPARESNASVDGTHLKDKALHIVDRLGVANFSASNGWIIRFKDTTLRRKKEC
jgi:centromere protein B